MPELRSVDPRTLTLNPNNPRRTATAGAMDEQLIASIKAIGLIQPPIVRPIDGALAVTAGNRRVKAAIAAGLSAIDVLVKDDDEHLVPMESLSENLIHASMNRRAVESLELQNWNEQAIADALALPVRTIRRLKLLAHLHSPMLDAMARGDMPSEEQLRTIAAATIEEQAQVWKKHKPRKGEATDWWRIASALQKRHIPFSAARFDDDLARAYAVTWHDDLFVQAGEDGCYTTDVEGFFGAQQEWLANNLPERGSLLPHDEHGRPELPKKAERVWGKPGKSDRIGCYVDPSSGEIKEIAYRMPPENKGAKNGKDGITVTPEIPARKSRPDVTQKGNAMIGDFRTDALHEALARNDINDTTFVALLILALAGRNVTVHSGADRNAFNRHDIANPLIEGGVVTADLAVIRKAARNMLIAVLSCRDNMSNSGPGARIGGETIGASAFLPSMATDEFLSCLSRQALEREATASGVAVEARVKDTRAHLVERFAGATWHYPGALFALTEDELSHLRESREWSQDSTDDPTPGADELSAGGDADGTGAGEDNPSDFPDAAE